MVALILKTCLLRYLYIFDKCYLTEKKTQPQSLDRFLCFLDNIKVNPKLIKVIDHLVLFY